MPRSGELVMGDDFKRAARPDEVTRMEVLVEQGMREGAVALSTGLEYDVGGSPRPTKSSRSRAWRARFGGFYISHIRDEADKAFEAMREVVTIAEQARLPVQNTHIKLGTVGVWRRAKEALALYEAARAKGLDVTADAYPYDAWSSTITVLIPSRRLDDPAAVGKGLADVGGAANVLITRHAAHPDYEFKTPGGGREGPGHYAGRALHADRQGGRRLGRVHLDGGRGHPGVLSLALHHGLE